MALPPRTPCPARMSCAGGGGGELVQPGGHGRGEQRAPHPGQVDLGVSGGEVPEGGAELAVAEDVLHRGAVPVPVLGRGRLVRAGHVQVGQDEAVGVDRPAARQSGNGRARWSGCRVRRRRDRGSAETCSGSSRTRRISSRVLPATSPGSTPRRRPARRPCRSRRASRPRRCRPAAATAARSAWRRSRS